MNESNKMPYLLAAGAIGGAVGYLFLTNSGKRLRDSVCNMETSSAIPDKIEDARRFIEKRGQDVSCRIQGVVDHLKGSIDEGKRTFEQTGTSLHRRMEKLNQTNNEVVSNIHRALDNMSNTIRTVEQSVLEPIFEMGSIVQGVQSGVKKLVRRSKCESDELATDMSGEMESGSFGVQPTPFTSDPGRERMRG